MRCSMLLVLLTGILLITIPHGLGRPPKTGFIAGERHNRLPLCSIVLTQAVNFHCLLFITSEETASMASFNFLISILLGVTKLVILKILRFRIFNWHLS